MIFWFGSGAPAFVSAVGKFLAAKGSSSREECAGIVRCISLPPPPPPTLLFRTTVKFSRTSQKSAAGIDGELSGVFVVRNERHLLAEFSRRLTLSQSFAKGPSRYKWMQ